MMNKKAVSPLIATVLLVMIVVSIGAAVMVVIQGLSEEQLTNIGVQEDLLRCSTEVSVQMQEVSQKPRMCLNVTSLASGNFSMLILNNGQKDITGFRVTVFGDSGFNQNTYPNSPLAKGALVGFKFSFNGTGARNNQISKIIVAPQFSSRETVTCELPSLLFEESVIDSMEDCSSVTWDDNII